MEGKVERLSQMECKGEACITQASCIARRQVFPSESGLFLDRQLSA